MENGTTAWITLSPSFERPRARELFIGAAIQLKALPTVDGHADVTGARVIRDQVVQESTFALNGDRQPLSLAVSVLCDLVSQGWGIDVDAELVRIKHPIRSEDSKMERERVRRSLLIARNEQLSEPAVEEFVRSMEARRLGPHGTWCSIFSLMRDGLELAASLRDAASSPTEVERREALRHVIKPYLQFVTEDAVCEQTGMRLMDIWRYFRHTWLTPYQATPGRTMMIIVRDAAVDPHPVIGIAALASSIVHQGQRDEWIGWTTEAVLWDLNFNAAVANLSHAVLSFGEEGGSVLNEDHRALVQKAEAVLALAEDVPESLTVDKETVTLAATVLQASGRSDQDIPLGGAEAKLRAVSVHDRVDRTGSERGRWLLESLDELLAGIYRDDFLQAGDIAPNDLEQPTPEALSQLQKISEREMDTHRSKSRNLGYRRLLEGDDWAALVTSPLYRSKRASTLSELLAIRRAFSDAGFTVATQSSLGEALRRTAFRKAVARLVRHIKATRVGINMMDISICGAVAPYNALRGGKLVSLLLASPQVRKAYSDRYGRNPSIIASKMKGEPVVRKPDLVLLCTTGLFSDGSYQYNRIRMPADKVGGRSGALLYKQLDGYTASFGTFHISQNTMRAMRLFSQQVDVKAYVNHIFGEGVSPKIRKIRQALEQLGFPPDQLLKTGSPRSLYVVPLAHNFRDVLLGRSGAADFIVPDDEPVAASKSMAEYWSIRWLLGRVGHSDVLQGIEAHRQIDPRTHGARVTLPESGQLGFDDALSESHDLFFDVTDTDTGGRQ